MLLDDAKMTEVARKAVSYLSRSEIDFVNKKILQFFLAPASPGFRFRVECTNSGYDFLMLHMDGVMLWYVWGTAESPALIYAYFRPGAVAAEVVRLETVVN